MSKAMFRYTKSVLERVSFDVNLFTKELQKAIQYLLPFELEELKRWFYEFTKNKPELKKCDVILLKNK